MGFGPLSSAPDGFHLYVNDSKNERKREATPTHKVHTMSIVGYVPVYQDASGQTYVDSEDAESGFLGMGPRARADRLSRRISRLQGRESRLLARMGEDDEEPAAPADIYQAAAASGMINENQYNGLGWTNLAASTAGTLQDTINRHLWGKSLVLNSDSPAQVIITGISVAGLPVNVGAQGAPLSMFQHDATRYGISFGRRLALVGQTFLVNATNIDAGSGHIISGGIIADELNPYAMQRWMEQLLLQAAVSGFQGF